MLRLALGQSDDIEPEKAFQEALDQCLLELKNHPPRLAILFTSIIDTDHRRMLARFRERFPETPLVGCTTTGEFSRLMGSTEDSVLMAMVASDRLAFEVGVGGDFSNDPEAAMTEALSQAGVHSGDTALVLCFPDGISSFTAPMTDLLNRPVLSHIPVFGGGAADGHSMKATFQFANDAVHTDAIAVVAVKGKLLHGAGVASGWNPIGKKGRVTRSLGNIVYEIDDKPALSFFHHYMDSSAGEISQFPLAVYENRSPDFYLRAAYRQDAAQGWIAFSGHVPAGAHVQIAEPGRKEIIHASRGAIQDAFSRYPGENPAFAFCASCASRCQVLGSLKDEALLTFDSVTGALFPFFGFYCYGEIAPTPPRNTAMYHCDTFAVLVLGED